MKRLQIAVVLLVAALVGCARPTPMPDVFPETLGGWHRVGPVRELAQPPDAIPAQNIQAIRTASYDGPGKLDARVYALPTPAVALDVVQRWRPRPNTLFFYSDRFVVVVQCLTIDKPPGMSMMPSTLNSALQAFMSALEKRFPAAPL
jgi:hypothetical protein